jgi:Domain of unknown function (DUF4149)
MSQNIISAVIGIMIFFTIAVAPTVFMVLPKEWSSAYVRKFFPKYYLILGILCAVAGMVSSHSQIALISYICAALFAFSLLVLTPMINKASDEKNTARFNLFHRSSVLINIIQLILLVYAIWLSYQ